MKRFKFSNFNEFRPYVRVEGIVYKTPEHLYQSRKTLNIKERNVVAGAGSPGIAKQIGKHVQLRGNWNEIKLDVMRRVQEIRFDQPYWEKQLLESTDLVSIVEYNWWHDNYWGACLCDHCRSLEKLNHLGKIIQEIKKRKEN